MKNDDRTERAVFLDRDGTIMEDANYLGDVNRVVMIDGAVEALKRLQDAGYRLFVVTNQSGVGRGYFTSEAVARIHAHLDTIFAGGGVRIQQYYVCPHHPDDNCDCRKPKPRFLIEAAREYGLDLAACFMVGDRPSDIGAGRAAGTQTVLVLTGAGRESVAGHIQEADYVASDIVEAADWILAPGTIKKRTRVANGHPSRE